MPPFEKITIPGLLTPYTLSSLINKPCLLNFLVSADTERHVVQNLLDNREALKERLGRGVPPMLETLTLFMKKSVHFIKYYFEKWWRGF